MYANRQCEMSIGYPREELYSPRLRLRAPSPPRAHEPSWPENFRRHLAGEEVPPYEYSSASRGRAGASTPSSPPAHRATTTSPAILGIVTDITTRKRTERLLQSLNAATLAMEQALTPAEIFPSAVRVLAGARLRQRRVPGGRGATRARSRPRCRGSGVSGEVRTPSTGERGAPRRRSASATIPAVARRHERTQGGVHRPGARALDCIASLPGRRPPGRAAPPPRSVAIFAPLVASETSHSACWWSPGGDLGPEDVQVFTAFAHQAAAAWRKTRLMRDLESSLEKLGRPRSSSCTRRRWRPSAAWRAASRTTSTTSSP